MRFSTYNAIEAIQDDNLAALKPSRDITTKDIANAASGAADQVRAEFINYFSAHELNGEFGVYAVLNSYVRSHPTLPSVQAAIQAGDYADLQRAFYDTMVVALAALIEKHAFSHILLTDTLPPESFQDQLRILAYAVDLQPKSQPAAAAAPVALAPVVLSEDEQCIQAYNSLPTKEFRRLYGTGVRRAIWDRLSAEGRL